MDFTSFLFERHFKKFLVIVSIAALIGVYSKYYHRQTNTTATSTTEEKDIIMELAKAETVEDVQRYIEQLPCEGSEAEVDSVSLGDLAEELMKWSDDEGWRSLVRSVVTGEMSNERDDCGEILGFMASM